MESVRAKKHLGQHFLTDKNIAERIVKSLRPTDLQYTQVLEVGPGMGVLSDFLLKESAYKTWMVDVDGESITYLKDHYPSVGERLIHGDFLTLDFQALFSGQPVAVIGNFPYHISSQIVFKILDERAQVPEVVGMFQKEVAERCAAEPGSKIYGILSVLTQAYYEVEYLFTVKAGAFNPPPKVLSGVIRLTRRPENVLNCDEQLFKRIVKAAFNQRRKTLRNALSGVIPKDRMDEAEVWDLRAERLSVQDFADLTNRISSL
jgi:16S rRNA (adenine1518-N6/adenine1519-N6)-dimethyltransferase